MLEAPPARRSARAIARELAAGERGLGHFVRRHRGVLVGAVAVLIAGYFAQPLFVAYRGVVLAVRGDAMLVQRDDAQLAWVRRSAAPGDIVLKRRGHLDAATVGDVTAPAPEDAAAVAAYARYQERYEGVVLEIGAPKTPGAVAHVRARVDGESRELEVFGEAWRGAHAGDRVVKERGSWEPVPARGPSDTVHFEAPR